ncbi:MAG: hypothetical protein NDJ24_10050 [Alphaproteobacteria bacterium]|nr:hypothetical protein [Alphaproteobacteria bacterium]
MKKDSAYNGTSIGFVTNTSEGSLLDSHNLGQAFSGASSLLDRTLGSRDFSALRNLNIIDRIPGKHLMAAFLVSAAAITVTEPEIIGAAAGDFSRARAEALQGNKHCGPEQTCTGIERLGEFSGNIERRFEQGYRDGLKKTLGAGTLAQ